MGAMALFFLLGVLISSLVTHSSVDYCVCPTANTSCNTLDDYATNASDYFNTSNTEFIFLSGNHTLSTNVTFSHLSGIKLRGKDLDEFVSIECTTQGAGFEFEDVQNLEIAGLTFGRCSRMHREVRFDVNNVVLQAALYFHHVTDLTMHKVTVHHTEGFGTFWLDLHGYADIAICTFQFNVGSEHHVGGNAALFYEHCEKNNSGLGNATDIVIYETKFLNGSSPHFYMATGLVVALQCPNVEVSIRNVTMTGNEAKNTSSSQDLLHFSGGNLAVIYYNTSMHDTVKISNSTFSNGNSLYGGGIFVRYYDCHEHCGNNFSVSGSEFIRNCAHEDGGAIYLSLNQCSGLTEISKQKSQLEFNSCSFCNNTVVTKKDAGIGMTIVHKAAISRSTALSYHSITLDRCVFKYNVNSPVEDGGTSSGSAALYVLQHSGELLIRDCLFDGNNVTALAAFRSKLYFSGNVILRKNSGYEGGGIVLCEASYMILYPNTTLTISDNHAFFTGGGIFAESRCVQVRPQCFYQIIDQNQLNETLKTTRVQLINNTAEFSGSQLFGGTADNCHIPGVEEDIFFKLFNFTKPEDDISYISSDPLNVCFCNPKSMKLNCSMQKFNINNSVYLGQEIEIPLVTVGQYNGTVPGEVEFNTTTSKKVVYVHSSAHTNKSCGNVVISVFTDQLSKVDITVKVKNQHATYRLNLRRVSISLSINRTPLGFNFSWSSNGSYSCISKPNITREGFKCMVKKNRSYIQRPPPKWLGYCNDSGFIMYHHCPLDFCVPDGVDIQTNHTHFAQDVQCANSRSGTLCGQCKSGYSIGLGPLSCIDCSHHSMLKTVGLSIAFLIVGLVMVVFLLLVDFTLTQGTMSELLFYANTFFIYRAALLPADNATKNTFISYKGVLETFVNVINLNYWHSYCFYNGLDLVGRTWLQFLLVIYLWLITIGIVFLCRKSARLANHIGSKAVPVLATILLLSCSPLNLSVLYSLTFASMEYPETGKVELIMLFDGNVPYFKGRHIPLFVAGCIFAVFSVCFTLILLCVQPLQRYSHLRPFRWVNKLKPLLDAYTCPHIIKPHCRFWNGFLLLVRMALYICFIVEFDNVLFFISIACLLVLSVAWAMGGVYTKQHLNILSSSYITNIGILSFTTTYIPASNSIISCLSTTVASFALLCTIACHIQAQLKQNHCFVRFNNLLPQTLRKITCKVFPRNSYQIMRNYAIQHSEGDTVID